MGTIFHSILGYILCILWGYGIAELGFSAGERWRLELQGIDHWGVCTLILMMTGWFIGKGILAPQWYGLVPPVAGLLVTITAGATHVTLVLFACYESVQRRRQARVRSERL